MDIKFNSKNISIHAVEYEYSLDFVGSLTSYWGIRWRMEVIYNDYKDI